MRRIPLWTWSRPREAISIHAKLSAWLRRSSSGAEVGVAEELRSARLEQQQVFEKQRERAEERGGLLLAFGSGAVGLGHLEEGGVVGLGGGVADEQQRVGAGGGVGFEVEAEGFACRSLREAGDQGALFRRDVGAAVGEQHLDLFYRQRSQTHGGAAGADGGEKLAGILREDDEVDRVAVALREL